MYFFPVCLMECKYSAIIAIIFYSKIQLDILQCQNFDDGSFIKPYLTIPFYVVFVGGIDSSTISFHYHGLICCPDSCYKLLVTEEVGSGFIVEQEHVSEI